MIINYWDCDYSDAEEKNCGAFEEPDTMWIYYCKHPKGNGFCYLENKYGNEEDNCKLLDD